VDTPPRVIDALRRFLPAYLASKPSLSAAHYRAITAIMACRTAELGGHVHSCDLCHHQHYAYHSCNHKACPQCGRADAMAWVQKQDQRRINAPYFMVTITVPEELREQFFGDGAKQMYDHFFQASARALQYCLSSRKSIRCDQTGFISVLHTWNQRLLFHPHLHIIVPAAGLDEKGNYRQAKDPLNPDKFLPFSLLAASVRRHMRELMAAGKHECDPSVWRKKWKVQVQAFGDGLSAIKYIGRYVSRSVIGDSRIVKQTATHVSYRWKDRQTHQERIDTLTGVEFTKRYLRHVLPPGLHSIRYHGYCHPAAKKTRLKVTLLSGKAVDMAQVPTKASQPETTATAAETKPKCQPQCPHCKVAMRLVRKIPASWDVREIWRELKHRQTTARRAPNTS
jgi:hypothetical protein